LVAEFLERDLVVEQADVVEVTVDPAVEEVAEVPGAFAADRVGVADDVHGATGFQKVVELGLVVELVDAFKRDEEEEAGGQRLQFDAVEIPLFVTVGGARADEVLLRADEVDQLELLEHRGDRGEALADFRAGFDGDADRR